MDKLCGFNASRGTGGTVESRAFGAVVAGRINTVRVLLPDDLEIIEVNEYVPTKEDR